MPFTQESIVQEMLSSHTTAVNTQAPLIQVSAVHRLLSVHTSVSHGLLQPGSAVDRRVGTEHESIVQTYPSSKITGLNWHWPLTQLSVVQAFKSSQLIDVN